jgi:predicted PurR-regulated permease PerM
LLSIGSVDDFGPDSATRAVLVGSLKLRGLRKGVKIEAGLKVLMMHRASVPSLGAARMAMKRSHAERSGTAVEREHPAPAHGEQSVTAPGQPPATSESPSTVSGVSAMRAVLVALTGGAGLFLAWMAADTLLLIFAGLLFAALLDACIRGLSKLLPIGRGWNLAIVSFTIAIAVAGLLVWSGFSIAQQINDFVQVLNRQLNLLEQGMAALGVAPASQSGSTSPIGDLVRFLFPNPHQLFGEAQSAFTVALGGIGEAIIVVLIGGFVAADPAAYRRGIVELVPLRHRQPVGVILDETAMFLRRWLIGQLAAMLFLAILTWIMLLAMGVSSPLLLGIQAGLFNFIPYLGAVVGAGPILLMTLPLGTATLLITLGLYMIIHIGVGYVVIPLIQRQAVQLPPALMLASLILFGVLFGVASVAVATPFVAAIRHAVLRLQQFRSDPAMGDFALSDPR